MNLGNFTKSQITSLYPELISEDCFAQLRAFSDLLPSTLFSRVLSFEFVASERAGHTDFGFLLNFGEHSVEKICESFESVAAEFNKSPHWAGFLHLLQALKSDNVDPLALRFLWLVFDFNPSSFKNPAGFTWPPDPNIYFFFKSDQSFHQVETLRSFFTSTKMPPQTLQLLKKCYEECFSLNLKIANAGILCARSVDSIRLYIEGDALRGKIGHYLSLIGYAGDPQPLLDALEALTPYFEKMSLGFDIHLTIGDRIGVECYPPLSLPFNERKKLWEKILSILCIQKMLSTEKKDALIDWMSVRMTEGSKTLLVQTINHVKLLYTKEGAVSAKVYLMPRLPSSNLAGKSIGALAPGIISQSRS